MSSWDPLKTLASEDHMWLGNFNFPIEYTTLIVIIKNQNRIVFSWQFVCSFSHPFPNPWIVWFPTCCRSTQNMLHSIRKYALCRYSLQIEGNFRNLVAEIIAHWMQACSEFKIRWVQGIFQISIYTTTMSSMH